MHQVRTQQEAVAAIKRANGGVLYRWQWRNGRFDRLGRRRAPGWLLQWLGPDVFYSVKFVDVDADLGSRADDNLMSWVGQLRDLEVLNVHGNRDVTDLGLAHLECLTSLRFLYLNETGVTDAGLKHLRTMKKLEELRLENTRVTNAGEERLRWELNQDPPRLRIDR